MRSTANVLMELAQAYAPVQPMQSLLPSVLHRAC